MSNNDNNDNITALEDEEENSGRFPYPLNSDPLNRTSDRTVKNKWKDARDKLPKNADSNKWTSLIRATQAGTKHFLGIESDNGPPRPNQPNTTNNQANSRSLSNWNERVFKVMNNNFIFGGELKENKLDKYIENLDENMVDEADPFLYYKLTGGSQLDLSPKITVANMAADGLRKMTNRPKLHLQKRKMLEPGADFEMQSHPDEHLPFQRPRLLAYSANPVQLEDEDATKNEDNIDGPWDAFTHACTGNRMFGVGFCGRLCDNDVDPEKKFKYEDLLKSIKQHRPYFTYWITFVQIIVCLVSMFAYGLAPVGFSYDLKKGLATTINLEKQFISFPVKQNFWIGPAAIDLVINKKIDFNSKLIQKSKNINKRCIWELNMRLA